MDAYKETSERAEKLTQQVTELEAAKEAATANATDSARAKQLETELKESQAALILCRHERDELRNKKRTPVNVSSIFTEVLKIHATKITLQKDS
ncbi:hypothetical protein B5X24_HaOG217102 [Helicoverpa armigera]|uniref:Uncharacterized protein n=1 Tax=Helicoverpa armigera TaxID=29058 RepID=A0A2W1BBT9_HELAM|nr:hypothetical protein B5X24_HaOG217102 [Helicoverpa armigera]